MLRRTLSILLSVVITSTTFISIFTSCRDEDQATTTTTTNDSQYSTTIPQDNNTNDIEIKVEEDPAIIITELMMINTVGIEDDNGVNSPWIEFYNQSDSAVSLSEYSLVFNNSSATLPDITIPALNYAVVFVNGTASANSINLAITVKGTITIMHGEMQSGSYSYTNTHANYSYLTSNGSETFYPTPGYENVLEKDNLIISEFMSSNTISPIKGVACDWIELYNASEYSIDLSNYYASTDTTEPYRAQLPNIILESGDYIVLSCGEELPFKLSNDGESIYITRDDGVLAASVVYEAMDKNTAWTYDFGIVSFPSPGYENTLDGYAKAVTSRTGLVITEVISTNTKYSKFNGNYCDIIELYNNSDQDIALSEYYLSDKGSSLKLYQLPDVTLAPHEYYVVYCDSDVEGAAPFGISSLGENVWLSKEDGYISDALSIPDIPLNKSWGRYESRLVYFKTPSIGKANSDGYETLTQTPDASYISGTYSEPLAVTLSGEGVIHYTIDGTAPSERSPIYSGEDIAVNETMAIRAIAYDGDKIPSYSVTYNYFIDIPDYTLPIIKLSVNEDDMFGSSGIYTNYSKKSEIPANIAFYLNGVEEFSIDCGVKIFGAYSRRFPKKSLQIEFRKKYGQSKLEYEIFDGLGIDSFSNIVLRSGSQNAYRSDAMIADELLTSFASTCGNMPEVLVQAYRACNLYINSEYWGIYFIREKIDDDFIADHFGVSKSSVTIIGWTNSLYEGESIAEWSKIWSSVYTKKLDFTKDENYQWLADQLDLESFADVLIMRMYAGDRDPGNIRAFKSNEYDDGKWHFILYDNDMSFRGETSMKNRFNEFLNSSTYSKIHALFRALMKNETFEQYFLSRLAFHLNNTFIPEKVHAHVDEMVALMEHDMPYQIDRWKNDNNSYMTHLNSMTLWYKNLNKIYTWTSEDRIKWYVMDAVNALDLTADDVERYMGEEFLKYLT